MALLKGLFGKRDQEKKEELSAADERLIADVGYEAFLRIKTAKVAKSKEKKQPAELKEEEEEEKREAVDPIPDAPDLVFGLPGVVIFFGSSALIGTIVATIVSLYLLFTNGEFRAFIFGNWWTVPVAYLIAFVWIKLQLRYLRAQRMVLTLSGAKVEIETPRSPIFLKVQPRGLAVSSIDEVEVTYPHFLAEMMGIGLVRFETVSQKDAQAMVLNPRLVKEIIEAWYLERQKPDVLQSMYEGWREERAWPIRLILGIAGLVTGLIKKVRRRSKLDMREDSTEVEVKTEARHPQPRISAVDSGPAQRVYVEVCSGFPSKGSVYYCAKPSCKTVLGHQSGSSDKPPYPGLAVWVDNDDSPRLALFCGQAHCREYADAARQRHAQSLSWLRYVGYTFEGNVRIEFVEGESNMTNQPVRGAELEPDREARGAELVEDNRRVVAELVSDRSRPLRQRPAMIIASAVVMFLLFAGGSILLGRDQAEQSVGLTPTITAASTSVAVPTGAVGTRPVVAMTTAAKSSTSTPAAKALTAPRLVSVAECQGIVKQGAGVWSWKNNGLILLTMPSGQPINRFDGTEKLNQIGIVRSDGRFCLAVGGRYVIESWAFYKLP